MNAATPRWAISFADLALLLVAFFVLLHAGAGRQVAEGARAAFARTRPEPPLLDSAADALFEPGEARLLPAARSALRAAGARASRRGGALLIESVGGGTAGARRFDAWELAAARAAAVARAIVEGGARAGGVRIAMGRELGAGAGEGQRLIVVQDR